MQSHGLLLMVSVARFIVNNFSINLYFHFGWYSKRKKILELFYISRDKKYCKTIKCHSFWLFDLSEGLTFSLGIVFLSPDPEIKNSNIAISRLSKLMNLFSNPMFKVYCQYLNSALEQLILIISVQDMIK